MEETYLSGIGDNDSLDRLVTAGSLDVLDLVHEIKTLEDVAEHNLHVSLKPECEGPEQNMGVREKGKQNRPRPTCLPSNHDVFIVQMKNWLPLVSRPALAMLENVSKRHEDRPNSRRGDREMRPTKVFQDRCGST